MYALNKAQIIGHLTEAPQIRQTPTGQSVGDLNIMSKSSFTNAQGQIQMSTSFHSVVVWRGLADIAGRFLKKGSQVYIAGRIQTDEWEDDQGQKRYKTRITADDLILLDPKMEQPAPPQGSKIAGGLNQSEIIGNITRDPEIRQTPNGEQVCNFGVATNYSWKDRTGETQERTEFHNVVAWGDLAASIAETVKKGRKVYVAGRLQTRSWETPDGIKKYTTEIIADRALALGTQDAELGSPTGAAASTSVSIGTPEAAPAPAQETASVVPENPTEVPEISYESDVKPEDLPF